MKKFKVVFENNNYLVKDKGTNETIAGEAYPLDTKSAADYYCHTLNNAYAQGCCATLERIRVEQDLPGIH